jgi:uncharacterized protein HemX
MNTDKMNRLNAMKNEVEPMDEATAQAIQHFRASTKSWSEREFSRTRQFAPAPAASWFARMRTPVAAWSLACALLIAGVGVPLGVQQQNAAHQRKLDADRQAQMQVQMQAQIERDKATAAEAARQQAVSISDEDLLNHVDSDIAQAAPDALEPLASLMADSGTSKQ